MTAYKQGTREIAYVPIESACYRCLRRCRQTSPQLKDRWLDLFILLTQRRSLRQSRLDQADAEEDDGVGAGGGQGEGRGERLRRDEAGLEEDFVLR